MTTEQFGAISISGLKDLERTLRLLPDTMERKVIMTGLSAGGRVFRNEMRKRAPRRSGDLRKSIAVRREARRLLVRVGFRKGGRHAHLLEYGTQERFTRKGVSRGSMPAQPFIEPAIKAAEARAVQAMAKAMLRRTETEVRKLAR